MARTGRRSKQELLRDEIVGRLRENVELCRKHASDETLPLPERERWANNLTNAARALNVVLRDAQFSQWEKRMKMLEKQGMIDQAVLTGSEP
jgi:hypothetical protein